MVVQRLLHLLRLHLLLRHRRRLHGLVSLRRHHLRRAEGCADRVLLHLHVWLRLRSLPALLAVRQHRCLRGAEGIEARLQRLAADAAGEGLLPRGLVAASDLLQGHGVLWWLGHVLLRQVLVQALPRRWLRAVQGRRCYATAPLSPAPLLLARRVLARAAPRVRRGLRISTAASAGLVTGLRRLHRCRGSRALGAADLAGIQA
mmetsp:Transcript_113948/g.368172  ORF Transcript_113948/g.368172 Transcript_113948/m.368172 type:complete len:203 (-) Transcript_113948:330-938(-)